jgi:hypothetical protein
MHACETLVDHDNPSACSPDTVVEHTNEPPGVLSGLLLQTQEQTIRHPHPIINMSGLATKQQSQKIFEKLKAKQANKVRRRTSNGIPHPPG